jgi:hypothetical protein
MSPDAVTIHEFRSDQNPYAYVTGRPLVAVDPNGRELITLGVLLAVVAIGAVIGGSAYVAQNGFDLGNSEWRAGLGVSAGMGGLAGGLLATGVGWGIAGGAFGATTLAGYGAVGLTGAGAGMFIGTGGAIFRGEGAGGIALGGLETAATTGIGAMLGYGTGFAGAGLLGTSYNTATYAAGAGAISAGLNGAFTGARQTYNWESPVGYLAFAADSTWGLIGTTLGNILNIANTAGAGEYNAEFSRRQNRQVFDGGVQLKAGFDLTLGNFVSHDSGNRADFLNAHEDLHIWQNRAFGPVYTVAPIVMGVVGVVGASIYAPIAGENWGDSFLTLGYYNNPFEAWAYSVDNGGNPDVPQEELCWWCN